MKKRIIALRRRRAARASSPRCCASRPRSGGASRRRRDARSGSGPTRTARRRSTRSPMHGPRRSGVTVNVVQKEFGDIRDNLEHRPARERARRDRRRARLDGRARGQRPRRPARPDARRSKKQFPAYALDAFSYGTAVKRLYGAPVALENIGLFVNTKLAKVPTTFAQLEKQALAFKKKSTGNLAIAVQQGADGDAYHMYPFFSGLGGYIFGEEQRRQARPDEHRRREQEVPRERAADRQVEQGGPDQLEGRLRHREERVPQEARPPSGSPARGTSTALQDERPELQDRPGARRSSAARCRSSASRASWSRSTRRRTASTSAGEGPGRQLHDAAGRAGRARRGQRPLPGEHDRRQAGQGPGARRSSARAARAACRCRTSRRWQSVWSELGGRGSSRRRAPARRRRASSFTDRRPQHRQQDRLDRRHVSAWAPARRAPAIPLPRGARERDDSRRRRRTARRRRPDAAWSMPSRLDRRVLGHGRARRSRSSCSRSSTRSPSGRRASWPTQDKWVALVVLVAATLAIDAGLPLAERRRCR